MSSTGHDRRSVTSQSRSRSGRRPQTRLQLHAERELVQAARAGRPEDVDALIQAFLPLIGSVARVYRGSTSLDRNELMQEGVVGLLRALERYDPALGTLFWAYASWWVRQAMQQLVAELSRPVVLSDRALRQLARIKDVQAEHVRRDGREPTTGALATACGMGSQQVQQLLAAERKPRALEEPLGGEGESSATLGDVIADPRAEDAYDLVPLHAELDGLPRLLEELTERESLVVRGRYGLDGSERTLVELGGVLGVSAERVRQIEEGALDKMRAAAEALAPMVADAAPRP
jgi:RNA polymerase primary sigma factor